MSSISDTHFTETEIRDALRHLHERHAATENTALRPHYQAVINHYNAILAARQAPRATRLMARDVVAGDVILANNETVTDVERNGSRITIHLSSGGSFTTIGNNQLHVTPSGSRPGTDTMPAGFSLHIGQDSLTLRCPTCEDCIFENDGDRYYQNFESGVPLDVLNVAAQLHVDRHHAKPQNAPSRAAAATPAPEATNDPAARTRAPQAPAPAHNVDHVECSHGKQLQKDRCHDCETADKTPHPYNGVAVRSPHNGQVLNRCKDCGLSVGDESHNQE
jgi:hypothetical protein